MSSNKKAVPQTTLHQMVRSHVEWLESNGKFGKKAVFDGMDLFDFFVYDNDLRTASFRNCNLDWASIVHCDLRGCVFTGSSMANLSLKGSDLRGAILDSSVLQSRGLTNTRWNYSDLPWWISHPDRSTILLDSSSKNSRSGDGEI
jgi:uncharacterized protein YjbI with pentapeptide repeats